MPEGGASAPAGAAAAPTWYDGGLRFECTQCGNCCTGPPGVVWLDDEEGRAMAAALGMEVGAFYAEHARRVRGRWSLRERRTEHGFDCAMLDRTTRPGRALCRAYGARPAQCRTWPFWPENLASPGAWEAARRGTPCPGMGRGPLVPVERIRVLRDESPA